MSPSSATPPSLNIPHSNRTLFTILYIYACYSASNKINSLRFCLYKLEDNSRRNEWYSKWPKAHSIHYLTTLFILLCIHDFVWIVAESVAQLDLRRKPRRPTYLRRKSFPAFCIGRIYVYIMSVCSKHTRTHIKMLGKTWKYLPVFGYFVHCIKFSFQNPPYFNRK